MTIDERLDRLVERHEALSQTVELLTRDIQQLSGSVVELRELARQDGENIRSLARIAEIHERRLSDLEGGE